WVERNAPPLSQVKQLWHIEWMGVHLSIKAKLVLAAGAGQELKSTMEEFNRACNTLSELASLRRCNSLNFVPWARTSSPRPDSKNSGSSPTFPRHRNSGIFAPVATQARTPCPCKPGRQVRADVGMQTLVHHQASRRN